MSAPEANAYEFQSHGVIEMLEKLLDKFIDERTTLEKEEMNSKYLGCSKNENTGSHSFRK